MTTLHYVAGLLFSVDRRRVALVRKNRPAWQAGRLNAIGGKIEGDESAPDAMRREFLEETGIDVPAGNWTPVADLYATDYTVAFFASFSDQVHRVRTMEDEEILTAYVADVLARPDDLVSTNLPVVIALALDRSGIVKPVALSEPGSLASPRPESPIKLDNQPALSAL